MVSFATRFSECEEYTTVRDLSSGTRTIVLVGPTAGGKTALSLELAKRLVGAEIVSADSMQVYRGMDIGTAKVSPDERARVRHHLIDCADPHEGDFTMMEWLRLARTALAEIHDRGHVAIVVGGTNLYVRALLDGVADAPTTDERVRAELALLSDAAAREELERIDPITAARIHSRDRRRTLRAIELYRLTGEAPSELRDQWKDAPQPLPEGVALVGIDWDVTEINGRINERVRRMFRDGIVDEVRSLLSRGALTRQAIEAVGYREVAEHLADRMSLEKAMEQTKIRSRRLGKQQRTWLRRFKLIPQSIWLAGAPETEGLADQVLGRLVIGQIKDSP